MPDYSKGKIYTIRCNETDDVYVGSTAQSLAQRFAGHKTDYKRHLIGKGHSRASFEILKYPSAYIELVEEYPCENKDQLNKREGEVMRSISCVNIKIAGRTKKEYGKQYKDTHKEIIKEQNKQYRDTHKEVKKKYQAEHKETIQEYRKEYRTKNKDKLTEKGKAYYQKMKNDEEFKAKRREYKKQWRANKKKETEVIL